ncbi:MAG: phenylalanine--tRNA ligase subunit beta [Acidobacteria bacterium]|nr:phenylalanine--tRNA ligase subunit beta [Acidobacteriota bacterium]
MNILVSWLREYVEVPDSPEDLARTMSVRGFSVEGIESSGDGDAIVDFEVTANRPDCMSVVGMAREVATAYNLPLRLPASPAADSGTKEGKDGGVSDGVPGSVIDIRIDDTDRCPRYVGAVVDVHVAPSPAWLQARLQAAGVRPLSNVVDVTNYVLLELGQPMHAFDLTALAGGQIRVRTARPGETLRTLDGQTRAMTTDMLVIADGERATAVAGVMGGGDSEVTPATTTIVLESACFDALSVRRTSKALGLKTEASMRFERGADPNLPLVAMQRAVALLESIGAGTLRGAIIDRYPAPVQSRSLRLRRTRLAEVLGAAVPDGDVRRILRSLDFTAGADDDGWDVGVPTRRVDVTREVDLIEEVARHYGFDRIPVTFPPPAAAPRPLDPRIMRARQLRGVLTGAGFSEAVTFGFVAAAAAAPFAAEDDIVPIANPLSETFAVLRPSALPGLIDGVAHNRRRERRDVRLFEIGARFGRARGESQAVACAWTGLAAPAHVSGTGRDVDFFDMKAVVERVCETMGVTADVTSHTVGWLAPGRSAAAHVGDTRVATFGQLAREIAHTNGLSDDPVYVADIDLDAILRVGAERHIRVEPLPRYPAITRDLSVLLDDTLAAADVRQTIRHAAPATLIHIIEFDRYQGKGIPDAKVSLSLRLTFRSSERTLTDADAQTAMDQVMAALTAAHGAVQR